MWVLATSAVLRRLRFDVSKTGVKVSESASAVPFTSSSIYSVHRRLFPKSGMRKAFGFVVIAGAFTTLMFGVFLTLGV